MKRIHLLFLTVLVLMICVVPHAEALDRVFVEDNAQLLTTEEEELLLDAAFEISENYGIDAVVLTVNSLEGKPAQAYADDYYDRNGYADDGLLFLIAIEDREWYISTSGKAIYAFTDYGLMQMEDRILPLLSDGDYYSAFAFYMNGIPEYMDAYVSGIPIDGHHDYYSDLYHEDMVYYETERSFADILSVSIIIGLIGAGISILVMCMSMNTKRARRNAGDYLDQNSFRIHTQRDIYLYSNISKVKRQKNSDSSFGGSGTHRSSSGHSHGGRGGKF